MLVVVEEGGGREIHFKYEDSAMDLVGSKPRFQGLFVAILLTSVPSSSPAHN